MNNPLAQFMRRLAGQPEPPQFLAPIPPDVFMRAMQKQPQQQNQRQQIPQGPIPADLYPLIVKAAKANGMRPEELAAALSRESAQFNPKYVKGWHVDGTGRGIAGIDKKYHPEVSDQQAFDPDYSINWMAKQLRGLQQQEGDFYNATRAYNGGPAYASSRQGYGGETVDTLTRRHADTIRGLASEYKRYFNGY